MEGAVVVVVVADVADEDGLLENGFAMDDEDAVAEDEERILERRSHQSPYLPLPPCDKQFQSPRSGPIQQPKHLFICILFSYLFK